MKRSKFSEAQVAFILRREEEGTKACEVRRKRRIPKRRLCLAQEIRSSDAVEVTLLRQLEDENARLKRIVAGRSLDNGLL